MTAMNYTRDSEDYQRIEQAIQFLEEHARRQPTLDEVASSVHLSAQHFQRMFQRWAGISPKRFLQFLTKEYAKEWLDHSASLLDATYAAGLSSPGRLHDLFVQCEAVTPGEYKTRGAGLTIRYGFHPTPYGECLLAMTDRGICSLAFLTTAGRKSAVDALRREWKNAEILEDPDSTAAVVEQIFFAHGQPIRINLFVKGTNFQIKVWEALLQLQPGEITSYQDLAERIGHPGSARAVGNALARNPVAYLIPCHRVIQKMGAFGHYRYGKARKQAILLRELGTLNPE